MKNLKFTHVIAIAVLIVVIILDSKYGIPLGWYLLPLVVWMSMMIVGSFDLNLGFYLTAITSKKNNTEKKIAITFDDGPHPDFTLKVLDILSKYQAKATFFCIGSNAETYPEILKAITKEGHGIGNHSFSHDLMIDFNSTDKWLEEIKKTNNSIHRICGEKTHLFRPPFGVTTPKLAKALEITEHKVIGWNIRSYDTVLKNPDAVVKRIIKKIRPGAIILLHDTQPNIIPVLERLLRFLKENNYQTLTVNELLNEN